MKWIDYCLDRITMYRLVLYSLIGLLFVAAIFGIFHKVPYSPIAIVISSVFLVAISWLANKLFAWAFDVPTNVESLYITALILALIISPAETPSNFFFLFWAAVLAMLSKFVLAVDKKHIFNPAAISVVITSFTISEYASWWVGTTWLAPFVAIVGFLIIRKLRFADLAWAFFTTFTTINLILSFLKGNDPINTLEQLTLHSSMLFLGSVMVTEPMTMPPTKRLQMIFGAIVGALSVPQFNILGFFLTPEMALCIGNIFAYIVSPKEKLLLVLEEKIKIANDAMELVFKPQHVPHYRPGQYMEWTLKHPKTDSRGNRRYFTLASSPTEPVIRLGVKFYENGSSYKKALALMDQHSIMIGAQLAGEFTLPKNPNQKIAFLAGGIGITPFRSMTKYLIDKNERRDIVLVYSNKTRDEIAYIDIFNQAYNQLGIRTVYTLTDTDHIPFDWQGKVGRVDAAMIQEQIPDYKERIFYLSGPQVMVHAYEKTLKSLGVKNAMLKKDFFPGLV